MNLLFDLDGTLTDPAFGITQCIAYACEALGAKPPSPPQLHRFIGPPLQGTFRTLLQTDDASRRERKDKTHRNILIGAIVLAKIEQGELEQRMLKWLLDKALTRNDDRDLIAL